MNPKTYIMRLNFIRGEVKRLAKEWEDLAGRMDKPQTRKWYRFFSKELLDEVRKIEEQIDSVTHVEVED